MCRTACSEKCSHSCLDQLPCDGDNELGHMFMGKLDSKVAIITGGSGGIGGAAAKLFASEGGRIVLVDLDSDAMESIVADIGADQAMSVVANVSDAAETQAYVAAAVERFGGVDIAFLNAGIEGVISPISEYTKEMFDKVISVNVRGVFPWLKIYHACHGQTRRRQYRHHVVDSGNPSNSRDVCIHHFQARGHWFNADGGIRGG